jgi:hypothetical protein
MSKKHHIPMAELLQAPHTLLRIEMKLISDEESYPIYAPY